MADDLEFVRAIAEEAQQMLAPLETALTHPTLFNALLLEHGWTPPDVDYLPQLQPVLDAHLAVRSLGDALTAFATNPDPGTTLRMLDAVRRTLSALRTPPQPPTGIPAPLNQQTFWQTLLPELADSLFARWLQKRLPAASALLVLTGAISSERVNPTWVGRVPYSRTRVRWDRLGMLLSDPGGLMAETYDWDGNFQARQLLDRAAVAMIALGMPAAVVTPPDAVVRRFWGHPPADLGATEIPLLRTGMTDDEDAIDISALLLPIPAAVDVAGDPQPYDGLALIATFNGTIEEGIGLGGPFAVKLTGSAAKVPLLVVELHPRAAPAVSSLFGGPVDAAAGIRLEAEPEQPFLLLGTPGSHRVEVSRLGVGAGVRSADGTTDLYVEADLGELAITIQFKDGDGFLNRVLGTNPQTLRADTGLTWSTTQALKFTGKAGLKLVVPLNVKLGPVELLDLVLDLAAGSDSTIKVSAALTVKTALGPAAVTIEEVGAALHLRPSPSGAAGQSPDQRPSAGALATTWGFQPPKGLGVRVNAGPLTGGGYLYSDADAGQYAGAMQLAFGPVNVTALGLLNTSMPSGRPGFSLIVVVTGEGFCAIPLGFGFALTGVGGLLGINRDMDTKAISDGIRNRALDAVMFPKNPAENAPRLLQSLATLFPPREGSYVVGPMVRITWGPTALLTFDAAVMLKLPPPIKIAILGRMTAVLPDPRLPIVRIQVDLAGIIDFDRGAITVDAKLVDSYLAMFSLTGDLAIRIYWKATKFFGLSCGGFYPGVVVPEFPPMERLAISLMGDNPRLRLETYFAITTNSIQLGAKAEFFAEIDVIIGRLSAFAEAGFDAFVQFSPFAFKARLYVGFYLAFNRKPFLGARLEAELSGPRPWHIDGEVTFWIIFQISVRVRHTFGDPVKQIPPAVDLGTKLREALDRDQAWSAELPRATSPDELFTLRPLPEGERDLRVHPYGQLTVRQDALPFDLTIQRFGQAVPAPDSPRRFSVDDVRISVGHQSRDAEFTHITNDFAVGQFLHLTEDQKIKRPAFESLPAGITYSLTGTLEPDDAVVVDLDFDSVVLDAAPDGGWQVRDGVRHTGIADWALDALLPGAAAARAHHEGPPRFAAPARHITVSGERFVTMPLDRLPRVQADQLTPTSFAQAAQQIVDGDTLQVVTVSEVIA